MKTVMKKLFSLMLVAVLLVSVVPAAFAAEVKCPDHPKGTISPNPAETDKAPTCTEAGTATYHCVPKNGDPEHNFTVDLPATGHSWAVVTEAVAATCTAKGKTEGRECTVCGAKDPARETDMIPHTEVTFEKAVSPTCTANGLTESKKCSVCGTVTQEQTVVKATGHNIVDVPAVAPTCTKKGLTAGRACSKCDYVEVAQTEVPALGHKYGDDGICTNDGCNQCIHCKTDPCSCVTPGTSTLKIYVNLYTADVKTETRELIRYENISSSTKVYPFITNHADEINSELEKLSRKLGADYIWSGNVYDADNDRVAEGMNTTVGSGRTVYINAYTGQNRVYIYVHNSRSYSNIRVIQLDGKKADDTVTRSEVRKAVSKYYSLSSLSMFDEDGWDAYVKNDKTAQSVDTVTVEGNVTEIHVRISGTAKSSSATADSSNFKTGDDIFAPVMVLGVSASALAVLLYLNKKRAF